MDVLEVEDNMPLAISKPVAQLQRHSIHISMEMDTVIILATSLFSRLIGSKPTKG